MKVATTTADFHRYSESAAEIIAFYEGTGFRYLDFSFNSSMYPGSPFLDERWQRWIDEAHEAAAAHGLRFCQAHAPVGNLFASGSEFDLLLSATIRSIDACGRLGIPHIVVHQQDIGGFPSREYRTLTLKRNREFFARLFAIMEQTGVYVLIENSCDKHAPTKENRRHFPSTAAELLELMEYIDHPLLRVCWDTGHANIQGVDQYQSIVELGNCLRGVHIADNYGDMDSHVAPFQGTTNMDAVMQGLLDIDYEGYFTFEACHILRNGAEWPHFRREWWYDNEKATRLMDVPLALRRQAVSLLYEIGKHILTEYGCFEE